MSKQGNLLMAMSNIQIYINIQCTCIDLGMAIGPAPPPQGNFDDYDFLILLYICHRMRHIRPLRSVT